MNKVIILVIGKTGVYIVRVDVVVGLWFWVVRFTWYVIGFVLVHTISIKVLMRFIMIAAVILTAATAYMVGKVFISFGIDIATKGFVFMIAGRAIVTALSTVVRFEGIRHFLGVRCLLKVTVSTVTGVAGNTGDTLVTLIENRHCEAQGG